MKVQITRIIPVSFSRMMKLMILVFGTILIIFMIKPILAPRPIKAGSISLNPYKEEVLFDFIRKISGIVRAPIPRRIEIDCDANASASFNIGFIILFEEDLVLKLGLPLVAGLNTPIISHSISG